MTKKELWKEAEEYGLQQALWCTSESGDLRDAFIDGAEPREKRIKELEAQVKYWKSEYEKLFNED